MRSRPDLTVLIDPPAPRPGDRLKVDVRLKSRTETPIDGISVKLVGLEQVTVGSGRNRRSWTHTHVELHAEHPAAVLLPGSHSYSSRFALPVGLPPRYRGDYTRIDYTLDVRVRIPWWFDQTGSYDVPVAPALIEIEPKPGVFVSAEGGAKAGELYVELSLESRSAEPGGELTGTVAFTNVSTERKRDARVALITYERLFTGGGQGFLGRSETSLNRVPRLGQAWELDLPWAAIVRGQAVPFRFPIKRSMVPSFTGSISALEFALEVCEERTFSYVPVLRVPVVIAAGTGAPRPARSAVPVVGLARRDLAWQQVATEAGLTYVAGHHQPELRGTGGAVGVRLATETRADGTSVTVGRLAWPHLGMGFRVAQGSWTDRLRAREIDVGFETFDRRFHVRGRSPEQVRALLDEDLCALLLKFADVTADDDGAALTVDVALVDPRALAALVDRVMKTARAFDAAFARVPLPGALAAHAEAWRAFAMQLGGRFEAGRGAILDATFGPERAAIVTHWSDEGVFAGTVVHMPLGVTIDPEAVSPAVRTLAGAMERQRGAGRVVNEQLTGPVISITDDAVSMTFGDPVLDPAELVPVLEDLTRLVRALRGRGAAGPFR